MYFVIVIGPLKLMFPAKRRYQCPVDHNPADQSRLQVATRQRFLV